MVTSKYNNFEREKRSLRYATFLHLHEIEIMKQNTETQLKNHQQSELIKKVIQVCRMYRVQQLVVPNQNVLN